MQDDQRRRDLLLFFAMVALAALGNGLSDAVYANYFKDVYQVTTVQRALIEAPRELPGLLCAVIIAGLSRLGDIRTSLIAQVLAFAGLLALGLFTPSFGLMLVFLFINSLGMHLFMPLQDSIGMALAEPGQIGRRMGQYASVRMIVGFIAGLMVFFGFRLGFFTFHSPRKLIFLIGAGAFLLAAVAALMMSRGQPRGKAKPKARLVFRKAYRWYYLLTLLHGVQKQIAYVFGGWVIISILNKGPEVMSLLMIGASFISIFFARVLGRWIDRLGIMRMLALNAFVFVIVYSLYGLVVLGMGRDLLPKAGVTVLIIYALFILDRLSMQMGVVKSVYLKTIAVSDDEVTNALSTGISLDHLVSILMAQVSGFVWTAWGPHWVFFLAAIFSLGNLFVAWKVRREEQVQSAT